MALRCDPVCDREIVDEKLAPQSTYEGQTRHFCGEGCKAQFDASPDRYSGLNTATSQVSTRSTR